MGGQCWEEVKSRAADLSFHLSSPATVLIAERTKVRDRRSCVVCAF